jgi:hypothetical protein
MITGVSNRIWTFRLSNCSLRVRNRLLGVRGCRRVAYRSVTVRFECVKNFATDRPSTGITIPARFFTDHPYSEATVRKLIYEPLLERTKLPLPCCFQIRLAGVQLPCSALIQRRILSTPVDHLLTLLYALG